MKKIFLILVLASLVIACSSSNIKNKENLIREIALPEIEQNLSHEKIESNYQIFDTLNLPKPPNTFGKGAEYLSSVSDNTEIKYSRLFEKYDENEVLKYFKNLNVNYLGNNSVYFRWKTYASKRELYRLVANRMVALSKANRKSVLTLSNGLWQAIPINSVDTIRRVVVASRGESGIITHLLIETSNKKYLVVKELNIRKLLATNNALYTAKGGQNDYADKVYISNVSLLPSAHFAMEDKGDRINIYGSGNGHGVGMPQFSAYDMAQRGYSYQSILKKYYKNAELGNVLDISNSIDVVKVGLTSRGALEHSNLRIVSAGKIKIEYGNKKFICEPSQIISVKNSGGNMILNFAGKTLKTRSNISLISSGEKITLLNFPKSHTSNPEYRGNLTLIPTSNKFRVVNSVNIEDYLLQVVPSEMPYSFGLEALKTQAETARSFPISDYLKNRYTYLGFHVKDTVESQVYNNQKENEIASEAIRETRGEILLYRGRPIDAKYFSTSSGMTNNAKDVW